ncbi:hypothetical protein [Sinorhizobium sp. BG8]|uniref:hypothetical protein n=1 Tax=Sinorhizobium sp. BG8 TaxID=2613773 RepID=UPI001FEDFCDF|nr:hypothetical protein [Sinorhizobium sp. BG8]
MSKSSKLIVLAAFDRNDEGCIIPAFDPRQIETEERAVRDAKVIATYHAGVVAWRRDADPNAGEYGPPIVLYQHGEIPDME